MIQQTLEKGLSTKETAERLGVGVQRVHQFLKENRLPGSYKHGRDWVIPESALENVKDRKPGKPGHLKKTAPPSDGAWPILLFYR